VEGHEQPAEDDADRQRGRRRHRRREPGALPVAGAELVGHTNPARLKSNGQSCRMCVFPMGKLKVYF
jgi:hypothetical protein